MMLRPVYKFFYFILLIVLFAVSVFAQEGKIEGYIFDSQYNDPLPGANIYLEGTSYGTAADLNGKFVILAVPPGDYKLVAKYIGYVDKNIELSIGIGEKAEQIITLDFQSIEGEVIEVTAQAEGQMQAINQQLASNTISNIVSEARIKELPDVNAAESIGRLPGVAINRSGGEANKIAIRGLSPKYNAVTVNGVRVPATDNDRSVDLSLISSNMLDGIEVKKANTADMDADAAGGTVDLRLKNAPEGLKFNVFAQTGYAALTEYFGNYQINASVSNRFLDNNLGIIVNLNLDEYDRSADKLDAGYEFFPVAETDEDAIRVNSLRLQEETVLRGRNGGSIVMDYTLPGNGRLLFNSFFNQLKSNALIRTNNLGLNSHQIEMRRNEGTRSIFTSSLGIEQDFDWMSYDFSLSTSGSAVKNPHNYVWGFTREGAQFSGFDINYLTSTTGFQQLHDSSLALQRAANALPIMELSQIWVDEIDREEDMVSAQTNFKFPFHFLDHFAGYVKVGGKFRYLDRFNDEERNGRAGMQYGGYGDATNGIPDTLNLYGALSLELNDTWDLRTLFRDGHPDLSGAGMYIDWERVADDHRRSNFLEDDYQLGDTFSESAMMALTRALKRSQKYYGGHYANNAVGSIGNDYDGIERSTAAYVMAEIKVPGNVTLIPGIRYERDYSKYHGQRFIESTSAWQDLEPIGLEKLTAVRDFEYWLPSFHTIYDPLDWLKLRFAYTNTLLKPDYFQYAPITRIGSQRTYGNANNASIKPAQSENFDLSTSVYNNYVGFFTASYFRKEITDYILGLSVVMHPDISYPSGLNIPDFWIDSQPSMYIYINNPFKAHYNGLELDWQTHFWYLPSPFSGLIFNANYTYIESETKYAIYRNVDSDSSVRVNPNRPFPVRFIKKLEVQSRKGRLLDQPKHIINLTLGYDYEGFSSRFSFLLQSDKTRSLDGTRSILDEFTGDFYRFDVQLKQALPYNIDVVANFANINNRPDKTFTTSSDNTKRPNFFEYYGFTFDVGLRYRL